MKTDDFRVTYLIGRYRLGTLTEGEREELDAWIAADPDNGRIFESVVNVSAYGKYAELSSIDRKKAWRELTVGLRRKRAPGAMRHRVIGVAAAVVLVGAVLGITHEWFAVNPVIDVERIEPGRAKAILTLADNTEVVIDGSAPDFITQESARIGLGSGEASYHDVDRKAVNVYNAITVPRGGEYKVTLSDGTQVWLNSDSHIKYPMHFPEGERRVLLRGEAYFDVATDTGSPFVVETELQTLEVLGTEFSVYAYPDDPRTLTTLIEGSVRVAGKVTAESVVLAPGEQAQLDAAGQSLSVARVDVRNFTVWREGLINIQNNSLEQVLDKLSRWYDVKFVMTDGGLEDMAFEGDIPMGSNLGTVIRMLEAAGKIDFIARAGHIEVRKK